MKSTTLMDAVRSHAERQVFCDFIKASRHTPISYSDLLEKSAWFAHYFKSNGVRPGEVVLIILKHSPDLFYSFLGAVRAGAIPSFMPHLTNKQDSTLYWNSHKKLFSRIGGCTLITHAENIDPIRTSLADTPLRLLTAESVESLNDEFQDITTCSDRIAFLQHSSGTTGLKKGVALSHHAVLRQTTSYAKSLALSRDDRIVSWLPLYHDMGLIACFLLPLITGTPVTMIDPFEWVLNPKLLFDAIKRFRATLCWQPNFAFHHLCRTVRTTSEIDLSSMRAWIDCSEPCRPETFELFERRFAQAGVRSATLSVCYAMAEAVFAVTQTKSGIVPPTLKVDPDTLRSEGRAIIVGPEQPHQQIISAGKAIDGLTVRIVDEQRLPLVDRQVGEIEISGDCLFSGYFKLEEETARKLRLGWYRTGDLGFMSGDELYVTGRKNDLIIVHGRNYYAHELEYLVNQVPGIHPGRVVAAGWFRFEIGSEDVVIIAEAEPTAACCRSAIVNEIKQLLSSNSGLQVYDVHLVDPGWLIKTTSGKISRTENLKKYREALFNIPIA